MRNSSFIANSFFLFFAHHYGGVKRKTKTQNSDGRGVEFFFSSEWSISAIFLLSLGTTSHAVIYIFTRDPLSLTRGKRLNFVVQDEKEQERKEIDL
jgi:hypothetical protein